MMVYRCFCGANTVATDDSTPRHHDEAMVSIQLLASDSHTMNGNCRFDKHGRKRAWDDDACHTHDEPAGECGECATCAECR